MRSITQNLPKCQSCAIRSSSLFGQLETNLLDKARALLAGRAAPTADDVRAIALPVLRHRVLGNHRAIGDQINADVTMTGTINPDGTIGPVGGIPFKIEGAAEAGKKVVLIVVKVNIVADIPGDNPVQMIINKTNRTSGKKKD